jgi:hypothetical protein
MDKTRRRAMSFFKILIIVLVLIYILSPVDLIPDIFPISGWLDDAFLLGVLFYYLKRGRLPGFLSWLQKAKGTRQDRQRQFFQQGPQSGFQTGTQGRDPYEVLGLKPGARPDEIRTAYRRAVQAYHPDKVSHLGREIQEVAEKKFVEIQAAYERLMEKNRDGYGHGHE